MVKVSSSKRDFLAIPNGSLFPPTVRLLKKLGLEIPLDTRDFMLPIESTLFNGIIITRPQAIPNLVRSGFVKAGICGWDCVVEAGLENRVKKVVELVYSKTTLQPVKVVVISWKRKIIDTPETTVLSEYPELAKKTFQQAQITFSWGGTEGLVALGTYDYGICVVETGGTLKSNGLRVLKEIEISPVVLIVKKTTPQLEMFGQLFQGALEAEKYQNLEVNVSRKNVVAVERVMPAMESPTKSKLADGSFQLQSVIPKKGLLDILIETGLAGARDPITSDINIMIKSS